MTARLEEAGKPPLLARLLTLDVGGMLLRNTVVSTGAFLLGLAALWALVALGGMDKVLATGITFLLAQTFHYTLGRTWVFRGTDRAVGAGYVIFLANSGIGLIITVALFALLMEYTAMHYLVARVVVSVFAGLAMFVANATFNFRRV
ncbi:GtrA family protein [Croceicoccus sediminis]|uniref:GtrA family protein n=1 Tax=Croceicoccus sediminis TaxID=2571150 RepID=UPI001181DE3A|nr:GtrA family protein [Croceicoccus sediminis]